MAKSAKKDLSRGAGIRPRESMTYGWVCRMRRLPERRATPWAGPVNSGKREVLEYIHHYWREEIKPPGLKAS